MDYLYALQCLREAAPSFITYFFLFISEVSLYLSVLIVANLYWSLNKDDGAYIIMGYAGAITVNECLKDIFCINRPWILDSRLHVDPLAKSSATGYSFPSGHTTTATSFFGGLALSLKKRKALGIFLIVIIFLVALSRNWLGAHTLKDVLVAICHTALMLCLVSFVKYFISKNPSKDTLVTVVGIVLVVIFLLFTTLKSYPVKYADDGSLLVDPAKMLRDAYKISGSAMGFFMGWWLERHCLKFQNPSTKKNKILCSLCGSVILIAWNFGISNILKVCGPNIAGFIKHFVTFFSILYLYPLLYTSFINLLSKKKAA